MSDLEVRILGSGDAFGSGGRFQACIHVRCGETQLLLDGGSSSLVAMHRFGVDPTRLNGVSPSHLHGDHFGGLPFLVLHGQFHRRTRPRVVAGPTGVATRVRDAMEVRFPGSSGVERRFAVAVAWRDQTASPNAGWPMGAMAGSLGVGLAKPGAYRLGNGPDPSLPDVLRRAVRLFAVASALVVAVALGLSTLRRPRGAPS